MAQTKKCAPTRAATNTGDACSTPLQPAEGAEAQNLGDLVMHYIHKGQPPNCFPLSSPKKNSIFEEGHSPGLLILYQYI